MIDIKWILYKHKKFLESKRNAESSLKYLQTDYKRHRADENWFIRGTTTRNVVESSYVFEEDTVRRIEIVEEVITQLMDVIDTVERAVSTLDDDCKLLIQLRYIDGKRAENVRQTMNLTDTPYYHLQRIAFSDMSGCFSTKLWTMEYLEHLLFIPLMERFENNLDYREKNKYLQKRENEKKISSF
jgi:hypothetical protein